MRTVISTVALLVAASRLGLAEPQPSPTSSEAPLDPKAKKEVIEMEKELALAMEKRDTAVLEKLLVDYYSDSYEGAKKAMSKPGTIARCKAGLHNFLAIEQQEKISGKADEIVVEGQARLRPSRIDDTKPEEQWVHVRRFWEKKDGQWLLTRQLRRLME